MWVVITDVMCAVRVPESCLRRVGLCDELGM
jgi:hypothetical protein